MANNLKVEHGELCATNITLPAVYAPIVTDDRIKKTILSSGRISGKTSALVVLWWIFRNKFPDRDIFFCQATAAEIEDSIIGEIEKFLINSDFDVGSSPRNEWCIPKARDKIVHRGEKGETKFYPLSDSKGGQRTRGIVAPNGLSLVLFEEAQKNADKNIIEQAIATFIRQMDDNSKLVIVGNAETIGHWFVDFVNEKKGAPDWRYIYANCYDIWNLLSPTTQKFLEDYKKANYLEFRRIYLGDIHAVTSDVVFPQFDRKKAYIRRDKLERHLITTLIIGVDHATANDTFAIVPVAILDDGTTQTLEICYDDPDEANRSLAVSEQCELFDKFVNFLDKNYGLVYNQVKTVVSVDGAASGFIAQLRHTQRTSKHKKLWQWLQIKAFTAKRKDTNLGIIKNAFAYGVLTIMNEGEYMWDGAPNRHRLVKEIESQRYKNGKLNPKYKNDLCDALEYGLVPYYTNCFNMSYPIRYGKSHYKEINALASGKIIKE